MGDQGPDSSAHSVGAVCANDGDDPAAGAAGGRAERHIFNSVRDGG